jgi:transcriptional regulator GlxA family with amidase domain
MEEDRIFMVDGPIWTSAGMTAGFDLVLAMVDSDMGPQTAKEVARLLVISQRRIGGQKQLTALLDLSPKSGRIERVLNHIRLNLRDELSIAELAGVASLSPRQPSRANLSTKPQRVGLSRHYRAARLRRRSFMPPFMTLAEPR